jgi:hypothetical protein
MIDEMKSGGRKVGGEEGRTNRDYLEKRDLRTVRFCRQPVISAFEEFFKAVEGQLEHSGHDGRDERRRIAGQNGDGHEVSG